MNAPMLSAQKANAVPRSTHNRMRSRRVMLYAAALLGVLAGVWLA